MYLEALDAITSSGYVQIAPDQFALLGKEFKYQTDKWYKGNEFLGIGNRAYSYFNGWVYHNLRLDDYLNSIYSGYSPIWIGKEIGWEVAAKELSSIRKKSRILGAYGSFRNRIKDWLAIETEKRMTYLYNEELIRRTIIFGLKTSGVNNPRSGVDLALFENRFGFSVCELPVLWEELKELRNLGLLEVDSTHARLTKPGLVISEEICRELYSDEVKSKLERTGDKFGRAGL